jgi:hypothetical protein
MRRKAMAERMTPTGDVRQRVFPGLPSEESHPISNAGQANLDSRTTVRDNLGDNYDTHLIAEGIELARYDPQHKFIR